MTAKPHKVLGSVLIVLGLFLDPLVLAALFAQDGTFESASFLAIILFIEALLIGLGVMVYRKPKPWLVKTGLVIVSSVLFLLFTIFIDRMYGRYLKPDTANLVFPAYSSAKYESSEYAVTVRINNLGFRGSNTTLEKRKKRVVFIGDSFTFGWGVDNQQTWIHLLSQQYPEVEFLNLARGGTHPGDHVQLARKCVPLLKPDLLIVGVLQANDMHQLMQVIAYEQGNLVPPKEVKYKESRTELIRRILLNLYPHLMERFPKTVAIQERWEVDAAAMVRSFTQTQRSKYSVIPTSVRQDFENGLLNPSLIYDGLHYPNYFSESIDTSNALCQASIIRLHDHLLELEAIAKQHGATMIVLSMPNRPYGYKETLEPLTHLGFNVKGCDTLNADLPLQAAAMEAQFPVFYPSLKEAGLFYNYDGHWNTIGNRKFAAELINHFDTLKQWKLLLTSSTF